MDQDIISYQRKRFECITTTAAFTQEVINSITAILKAAIDAGQLTARIQTLHLAQGHYGFSRIPPYSEDMDHILHDAHTLLPIPDCRTRVHFNARVQEMLQWVKQQGLQWVCATRLMKEGNSDSVAGFVHIFAVIVPAASGGGDKHNKSPRGGRHTLYNTVYTTKCLDDSMRAVWNERGLAALRAGCGYFVVCVLYREADYRVGGEIPIGRQFVDPVTLVPLVPAGDQGHRWGLSKRFSALVSWVDSIGYTWVMAPGPSGRGCAASTWAYFIVLLDPLERYY